MADGAVIIISEMDQQAWRAFQDSIADLDDDEVNWRPLPQANSINIIVRHLCIEAQWHLNSLLRGERMPAEIPAALQKEIDAVPLDFQRNAEKLEKLYGAFLSGLRTASAGLVQRRTAAAYGEAAHDLQHLLAYHQALHLAMHCGQIRMIRNLYRKTRGEPARFFPENPTFPTPA